MFSSESFIVSGFAFRSLIHFEVFFFFFVCVCVCVCLFMVLGSVLIFYR